MFAQKLLARIAAFLVRLFSATLRYRITDMANVIGRPQKEPVIWAFWHENLFATSCVYPRFISNRKIALMVSASKDGSLGVEFMRRIGMNAVRGSSSRRGATALLEMTSLLAKKMDVALIPDGPRGPRHQMKPGLILLAQKTGVPIVLIDVKLSRCYRLKSWDRFAIPWPFSIVDVRFREPISIAPTETREAFEQERARLETELREWVKPEDQAAKGAARR